MAKVLENSFSISPSNEYSGLIACRIDGLDLLAVQGTLRSLLVLVCPGHLRWKVALLCTPPFGGASGLRAVCAAHVSLSGLSTSGLCCGDWRPVSTHAARCAVGVPLVLGFRDTSGSCQDAACSSSDAAADGPGLGARCGLGEAGPAVHALCRGVVLCLQAFCEGETVSKQSVCL